MLPKDHSIATEAVVFFIPGSSGKGPGWDLMPVTWPIGVPETKVPTAPCFRSFSLLSCPTLLVENQLYSFIHIMNNVGCL